MPLIGDRERTEIRKILGNMKHPVKLRFDIGYKIKRRQYESPYAYFLTFGYAF